MTVAWIAQSSIVALVILAATRLLRGRASVLREGLLLVALAKFVIPPALLPFGFLFDLMAATPAAPIAAPVIGDTVQAIASPGWSPLFALVVVYFAGVSAVLVAVVHGQWRLLHSLKSATYADAGLQARVESLAASAGCRRRITLQRSDRIAAPIAVGVVRRRIVVPAQLLASLSPRELDAVLLHEIAHHSRGHIASGWVRAAVCAAWWWNPLAWTVGRALRHTQEEVCDDLVIERAGMAADRYCDVLVRAASVASTPAGAAAFAQALHPLGRRVKRLLEGAPTRASAWQVWTMAAFVGCAVLPGSASRAVTATAAPLASAQVARSLSDLPRLAVAPAEISRPPVGRRAARDASIAIPASRAAAASAVEDEQPAPVAPPIDVPHARPLPLAALLSFLPEALVEIPTTVRETRSEAAESVRDVIYDAMRQAGAPGGTADDASRQIKIRIQNREVVRNMNRGILRALNPINWFKSASSSPSPSPSPSPGPSPSPSPSKDRR
jgi:beta-lactamase regulating signal transducer with metallopeptidase domain